MLVCLCTFSTGNFQDSQEGTFGSEHSASPSQGSSQQHFLEPEANLDDSIDIQQQVKSKCFPR